MGGDHNINFKDGIKIGIFFFNIKKFPQLCSFSSNTVTGKSLAHFFPNFFVAPMGEEGQFWNWSIL